MARDHVAMLVLGFIVVLSVVVSLSFGLLKLADIEMRLEALERFAIEERAKDTYVPDDRVNDGK